MASRAGQPQLAWRTCLSVVVLSAVLALAGCGGSGGAVGSTPTPTPTPTPVPTPVPTPTPLPSGAIEFKVLDSTVPVGGIYQYQLSTTEPKPIGHGSTRPQVPAGPVGPVRGAALNDPAGLAAGIAVINGTNISVQLVGPNLGSTLGNTTAYPLLTLSMPVISGAQGQQFFANFDLANSSFFDASQAPYTLFPPTGPGFLTIGGVGTPYVTDVVPAGGSLPDRTLIKIFGSGFTANTRVAIEDTNILPVDITLISATEVDVKICNGVLPTPAPATCPGGGPVFQLDGERIRVRDTTNNPTTQIDYYSYLRGDDVLPASSNTLVAQVHPMYASKTTYLTATIPLVTGGTTFTGFSLQNTSAVDDGIKIELLNASNATVGTPVNFILPGIAAGGTAGKKITRDVLADWFPGPVPAGAVKVRMTVTSGNAPIQALGMTGDTSTGVVTPVIPQ